MITKKQIEHAFDNYIEIGEESISNLYKLIYDFALHSLQNKVNSKHELENDAQDYAQKVSIAAWKKLPTFEGTAAEFYSWLNRVCYLKSVDASRASKKALEERVPLTVPSFGESSLFEDNPLLYTHSDNRDSVVHYRELPCTVRGKNLLICQLIREGMVYREIASYMNITESAVKSRVKSIRNKMETANA